MHSEILFPTAAKRQQLSPQHRLASPGLEPPATPKPALMPSSRLKRSGLQSPQLTHSSSPGGIRTCDQSVNSRPLYH